MRKVRCCYAYPYQGLTYEKIYDVIKVNYGEYYDHNNEPTQLGVLIIDDSGRQISFRLQTIGGIQILEDVTTECRNETINGILT